MILELPFPCVVRAQPPRCVSVRQVICTLRLVRDIREKTLADLVPVAEIERAEGTRETVMHDGERFLRRICQVADVASMLSAFVRGQGYARRMYLKLLDDEQRYQLEYSSLTWPAKDRNRNRRDESFDAVLEFDGLDENDVIRCRAEAERLVENMVVFDGGLWIGCEEPCYQVSVSSRSGFKVRIDATFADQDLNLQVLESFLSATDHEAMLAEASRLADGAEGRIERIPEIKVLDDTRFEVNFEDRAFLKFANLAVQNIAAYLAQDGVYEGGTALLDSDPDDISLWNELRQSVRRMNDAGTCRDGDDELVMRGAELWRRYGGASLRPRYHSAATVEHWFERPIQNWLDRPVRLWETPTHRTP